MSRGLYQSFSDTWILDGVRTPMVDYCGAFAEANPMDLGIKVAREILQRTGTPAAREWSAATGVRLTVTVARQLREGGARWGIASACVGGGQGIALLVENPQVS